MTRPIPRIVKGAADSMSIVAMLVYVLASSGCCSFCMSARIRRSRKQIIEVMMTFKHTLIDTHGTMGLIDFPCRTNS